MVDRPAVRVCRGRGPTLGLAGSTFFTGVGKGEEAVESGLRLTVQCMRGAVNDQAGSCVPIPSWDEDRSRSPSRMTMRQ